MWENSSDTVKEVYEKLLELHGALEHVPRRTPMRELISTILSQRTTHADEELAYKRMLEKFKTWEGVRDAATEDLAHEIRTSRYPETKAENIKKVLHQIFEERAAAEIDFLATMSTKDALRWLTALPGVGLKTATLLLLFNYKKPVLPVDTHVHRISLRVGLIPPKTSANKAHQVLLEQLPKDPYVLYNFHKALYRHGQRICTYAGPDCAACPLKDICQYYQDSKKVT